MYHSDKVEVICLPVCLSALIYNTHQSNSTHGH